MKSYQKQKWLWITDPWHTLDHGNDTTLRLAQEGLTLGIPQYWSDVRSLCLTDARVCLTTQKILALGPHREKTSFRGGAIETRLPGEFTQIHYRVDPPVNLAYLHPLQLLALGLQGRQKSEIINPFHVLFTQNEKTAAFGVDSLMPPSFVGSQWETLYAFGKQEKRTVLKPLHEGQSHGVELLDWRSTDSIAASQRKLMESTGNFTSPVILQKYLEGIAEGELRVWFLDGKLLAHVKKLPLTGDFRVNVDRGSAIAPSTLGARDRQKISKISRYLKTNRIRLAAVDLIEGFVTDFNFTSPGLIYQMESVLEENLALPIVKALAGSPFLKAYQ